METTNKEQIYDEQISPLMTQIIAICQQHKIPMLASFSIPTEADPDLACSTSLIGNGFEAPESYTRALRELRPELFRRPGLMIRAEHGDGSMTLTSVI
ncbi:hypothetical protein [Burkholderia cepacia]|uniref:Uncharacterized protein n=1 Tax=Burkholderia cepacia GG4 TaxID=1009846 RepID=A0A9W3PBC7_BURCE|nr:hypothetical protein [Burkholderia cepacia]AFQ50415.1 hypothetical protein GEM_4025 [Burkholderia cepacia GG4]